MRPLVEYTNVYEVSVLLLRIYGGGDGGGVIHDIVIVTHTT